MVRGGGGHTQTPVRTCAYHPTLPVTPHPRRSSLPVCAEAHLHGDGAAAHGGAREGHLRRERSGEGDEGANHRGPATRKHRRSETRSGHYAGREGQWSAAFTESRMQEQIRKLGPPCSILWLKSGALLLVLVLSLASLCKKSQQDFNNLERKMFAGRKKAKAKEVPAWKLQLEAAEAVAPVAQEECDATAAASSSGGTRDDGNSVDSIGAKRRRDDAVLRSESVEEEASRRDQRDCGGVDRPCSQSPASPSPSSPPSSQSPSPRPSATSARERSPDSETRVSAAESGADGASGADFIAASSFDGARTGRVFRLGPQGLG